MSITETLINYMYSLKEKGITYSMVGSRTGRDGTGDCSGTIYAGLVTAGLPTLQYPFSTESEHAYLLNNGYELIAYNKDWTAQRGDIFVWGEKGSSNGAGGHTGVFIDADNIIHTNYGYNGTTVNNYNEIYNYNLPNGVYVYRLKNQNQAAKPSVSTTTATKGKKINQGIYQVNELKNVNNIWQVRCDFLVPTDFNWTDNGVAVGDIVIVDDQGYILGDQTTKNGSYFVFDTNKIKSVSKPQKGSGGYNWCEVDLKFSGKIWLSVANKNDLINKVSNA